MSKLSIIKIYPENYELKSFCLNNACQTVNGSLLDSSTLYSLIHNMFETLYDYPSGVGLSANQVGIMLRLCVIDFKRDAKKPIVCINPEYSPLSDEKMMSKEQCLSFPNVSANVQRYNRIRINYQNVHGEEKEMIAEGFKSFVFQHEIDHLNGIVFFDRIDTFKDLNDYEGYTFRLAHNAMEVIKNG